MLSYKFASDDETYDVGNEDDKAISHFNKLSKFKDNEDNY